jgi:hypothetical protein
LKIRKGYVYAVTDIDISGKCKHGFMPLKDVPVDENTTVGDLIKKRDDEIKTLNKEISILKNALKNFIAQVGGVDQNENTK